MEGHEVPLTLRGTMSEYIFFHDPQDKLGPSFNLAASIIRRHDVTVKDQIDNPMFQGYLIEGDEQEIELLKKNLKGWVVMPNSPGSGAF